jgi:5-methylcytosine-specific restriction enzyme subunit McrC
MFMWKINLEDRVSESLQTSNIITLFERQSIPYQSLRLEDNDPLFEILDRLNQSAGIELIQLGRKEIQATQFVGVIQAGSHLIQILPKIDCNPDGDANAPIGSQKYVVAVDSASRNFMHLLMHTQQLKLHNQTLASLSTSHGPWLEMLTHLFAVELMTQLQQGFHQDYIRREDYLPYVRGRWNIARQFTQQPNLVQGLDVSYDDYLPDTLLNRVFRFTVNRLQQIARDRQNRQMLTDMDSWFQTVQLVVQLEKTDLDRIVFTRLNERFSPAYQLARLFLEGQTVQLLAGGQRAFAFVFDMDRLFEQFVANLMQTQIQRLLPAAWQGFSIDIKGRKTTKHLIQPPDPMETPMFRLEPDILIGLPHMPCLILDTKNKVLPSIRPYRDIAEADAYQMLAYATQFCCSNILLLYPRIYNAIETRPHILFIDHSSIQIFVATIDLHQPLNNLDRLIHEVHEILDFIQIHTTVSSEVVWPM